MSTPRRRLNSCHRHSYFSQSIQAHTLKPLYSGLILEIERGPAWPYCPKMGLASFRTSAPGVLAVPPTPADWLRFAFSGCPRSARLPIGFVSHQFLRVSQIAHPLVAIRRSAPQKTQLSGYTVVTEGSYEKIWQVRSLDRRGRRHLSLAGDHRHEGNQDLL